MFYTIVVNASAENPRALAPYTMGTMGNELPSTQIAADSAAKITPDPNEVKRPAEDATAAPSIIDVPTIIEPNSTSAPTVPNSTRPPPTAPTGP